METKWIELSPSAFTMIEAGLLREIQAAEIELAELAAILVVPPAESDVYVNLSRWLETARETLTLLREDRVIAVGVLIQLPR